MSAASHSDAYVQKEQIPPSPPPATETGIVKWLRENLFNGWFNSILTLVAAYCIVVVAIPTITWFTNGVWTADSIRTCREVLDGALGGCFAVLVDRWDHLLFGFTYPPEYYWRPTIAGILLIAAALPIMFADDGVMKKAYLYAAGGLVVLTLGAWILDAIFDDSETKRMGGMFIPFVGVGMAAVLAVVGQAVPRKLLLYYTGLFPFVAYFLIWGGSVWVPLTVLAMLIATGAVFVIVSGVDLSLRRIIAAVVGVIAALGLGYLLFQGASELTYIASSVGTEGAVNTITYGVCWLLAIFMYTFFIPMALFVGYAVFNSAEDGGLVSIVAALLFFLGATSVIGAISGGINAVLPIELTAVASRDMGGFMLNMILGSVCVALSIPLGIVLALGRQSNMPLIKGVCVVFIEFVRGVPLITLLFVANVMLAYFFPPESSLDLILRVIIMITMFSAAYIAEVIRGGLAALPRGQYEAGDSLGLNYAQSMRLIILPQALKISIPGIVNVAVGLFKDTTLVSIISMFDTIGMIRGPIQQTTDWLGIYWELFGFAALLFFVVCYGISQYSQWLERQLATDRR